MKIYSYFDIENQQLISDKIYEFIGTRTTILEEQNFWTHIEVDEILEFIPELKKVCDDRGLIVYDVAIILAQPNMQGGIHEDEYPDVRWLLPVRNTEGSYTKFFDTTEDEIEWKELPEGKLYKGVKDSYVPRELGSFELIKPVVFDPGVAHGIFTNPKFTEPRISCTIRFENPPSYMLED